MDAFVAERVGDSGELKPSVTACGPNFRHFLGTELVAGCESPVPVTV